MVKTNKKSIEAKAYINGKVNDMREQFVKAPDEEARKQLVKTFREMTSSDEYQENLKVVQEDTDIIRKYVKRKKWWDITSEEFKDAKTEFYGKDMNLEFWEDFEKLDLWKKVDYIFERFWDTDYAGDLILNTLSILKSKNNNYEMKFKQKLLSDMFYKSEHYYDYMLNAVDDIFNKFWAWQIWLRLVTFFADNFYWTWYDRGMYDRTSSIAHTLYYNKVDFGRINHNHDITESTLKYLLNWSKWARSIIKDVILWCKDYSISDHNILDFFVVNNQKEWWRPLKKFTPEWQKYYIKKFLEYYKTKRCDKYYNAPTFLNSLFDDMNLWEWVEPLEFIINHTLKIFDDVDLENFLCWNNFQEMYVHHKQIIDLFIKAWKIDIVKKSINYFTWLTEIEKAEIVWNTEL